MVWWPTEVGSPVCQTGLSPQYQSLKITYQLRVHVHNHITQAVAAKDSGFVTVGAHHVDDSRWANQPSRGRICDTSNSRKIHFGSGFPSLKVTKESHN